MSNPVTIGNATLYCGDCLGVMGAIPDGSIDMVLSDPPYGTTACKWDEIIPFAPLWGQYKRLVGGSGAMVLTASQPFTSALVMSNAKMFKYCWYWKKERGTGFATSGKRPLMIVEDVCVFYDKCPTYNPDRKLLAKPYRHAIPIVKSKSGGKDSFGTPQINEDGSRRYREYTHSTPHQLLEISRDNGGKGVHPTQKPVALFEYLARTYTNKGDTVLDNCMGSGTTGVACMNLGRKFIGIELEQKYFDIACERIEQAQKQQGLFE